MKMKSDKRIFQSVTGRYFQCIQNSVYLSDIIDWFPFLTLFIQKIKTMAEFSKQWCELNDPEMPWDFDILEVANGLTNNFYIHCL